MSVRLTLRDSPAERDGKSWLLKVDEATTVGEVAESLGMTGVISAGVKNEDEGLYPVQHGYWLETMRAAVAAEEESATAAAEKH